MKTRLDAREAKLRQVVKDAKAEHRLALENYRAVRRSAAVSLNLAGRPIRKVAEILDENRMTIMRDIRGDKRVKQWNKCEWGNQ